MKLVWQDTFKRVANLLQHFLTQECIEFTHLLLLTASSLPKGKACLRVAQKLKNSLQLSRAGQPRRTDGEEILRLTFGKLVVSSRKLEYFQFLSQHGFDICLLK